MQSQVILLDDSQKRHDLFGRLD